MFRTARGVALAVVVTAVAALTYATPGGSARAEDLPPGGTFVDDDGSPHEGYIEAIVAEGITAGCSTPDDYCPAAAVKRGQMAAFLVRALDLPPGTPDRFVDDDENPFEADIDALAEAGITGGCNPPDNDRFCPNAPVSRAQMATFLVRALELPAGTPDRFVDDDDSPFENDIDALAEAGITGGCNPPDNDRFCPAHAVTRAQMATFLARALGFEPHVPPKRYIEPPTGPSGEIGASDLPALTPDSSWEAPPQCCPMETGTSLAGIAAGPENLVLIRNEIIAILDKDGTVLDQINFGAWWAERLGVDFGSAYGRVIYDASSERFFMAASGRDGRPEPCELGDCIGDLLVAVSKSSAPQSLGHEDWHFSRTQGAYNNEELTRFHNGYLSVGASEDVFVIAMTAAESPRPDGSDPDQGYGKLRMFDKHALIAGEEAEWRDLWQLSIPHDDHAIGFAEHVATPQRLEQGGPLMALSEAAWSREPETSPWSSCDVQLWEMVDPLSDAHARGMRVESQFDCHGYGTGYDGREVPQPDGEVIWGEHHLKMFPHPVQVAGSIWGARTVSLRGAGEESLIHWFEIDISDWPERATMRQEGLLGAPGVWYDYPALSIDPDGNVGMTFRRASADEWASLYITGRYPDDPVGTMRPSTLVREGSTRLEPVRWGYWYGAATDPVDGRIWLHGQYAGSSTELTTYVVTLNLGAN